VAEKSKSPLKEASPVKKSSPVKEPESQIKDRAEVAETPMIKTVSVATKDTKSKRESIQQLDNISSRKVLDHKDENQQTLLALDMTLVKDKITEVSEGPTSKSPSRVKKLGTTKGKKTYKDDKGNDVEDINDHDPESPVSPKGKSSKSPRKSKKKERDSKDEDRDGFHLQVEATF
jgi:hypothetical protein